MKSCNIIINLHMRNICMGKFCFIPSAEAKIRLFEKPPKAGDALNLCLRRLQFSTQNLRRLICINSRC